MIKKFIEWMKSVPAYYVVRDGVKWKVVQITPFDTYEVPEGHKNY